eukprot:210728-Alexandrium_andersonii.AAC.2
MRGQAQLAQARGARGWQPHHKHPAPQAGDRTPLHKQALKRWPLLGCVRLGRSAIDPFASGRAPSGDAPSLGSPRDRPGCSARFFLGTSQCNVRRIGGHHELRGR